MIIKRVDMTVKASQRPVNFDVMSWFPITAIASILHRLSGIAVFVLIPVLLWGLQESLSSEQAFQALKVNGLFVFLAWITLAALLYHLVAGCKHLIMDLGFGETIEGGRRLAILVLLGAGALILLSLIWLW